MTRSIEIAGRRIGGGRSPYVIAELSGNHQGRIERALELVEAAAKAGVDAVKLQTYTADTITIDCDRADFVIRGGLWDGRRLYELYEEARTPWSWHEALFARARELGVVMFSSPFDGTAVDFLEELGCPAYKIASFELVDLPLLRKVAATGKPVIASTGMANLGEIEEAVRTLREGGCEQLALLHCVSGYPTPAEEMNLRTIAHIGQSFDVPVGLSDHTLDPSVAVAAVALGASIIEKHLTLRRADGGPDAAFSLEPAEFSALSKAVATTAKALGRISYERAPAERGNAIFRRSIYAVKDLEQGELLTGENVRIIRPGFGLAPRHLPDVLGRRAARAIQRGTPISWKLVDE
jgi:N-acetylneuraminate synthase